MTSITARTAAAVASVLITLTLAHQVALLAQPVSEAERSAHLARLQRNATPVVDREIEPHAAATVKLAAAGTTLR